MFIDVSEEYVSIISTEENAGSGRSMDIRRKAGESGALGYPTGVRRTVKQFLALQRVLFQPSLSLNLCQLTQEQLTLLPRKWRQYIPPKRL
jgi:hypothetical protein